MADVSGIWLIYVYSPVVRTRVSRPTIQSKYLGICVCVYVCVCVCVCVYVCVCVCVCVRDTITSFWLT
jgi:hypothetical protein